MNRDGFLGTKVMNIRGTIYSVIDVIRFESNIMGAIHAGTPCTDAENLMREFADAFGIQGLRFSLKQLAAIGRVALRALQPIKDSIV
jgi:hypothetical protein